MRLQAWARGVRFVFDNSILLLVGLMLLLLGILKAREAAERRVRGSRPGA